MLISKPHLGDGEKLVLGGVECLVEGVESMSTSYMMSSFLIMMDRIWFFTNEEPVRSLEWNNHPVRLGGDICLYTRR